MDGYWSGASTAARVDFVVSDNATWLDPVQFDPPLDSDADDPSTQGDSDADDTLPTWGFQGQNFRLDIKGSREDSLPLLSITSGVGQIVVDDVVNRILHFNVPESILNAALVPGEYVYDLIMFDNSAPPVRIALAYGKFTFTHGVTGG